MAHVSVTTNDGNRITVPYRVGAVARGSLDAEVVMAFGREGGGCFVVDSEFKSATQRSYAPGLRHCVEAVLRRFNDYADFSGDYLTFDSIR
ncbi:hypothetical protein Pan14r_04230 [Crateriforma conspicua]|uniref:Uncharacterized protein n=1 Tax=Crateriforma conspicua TaxID=2527996 RepID=A0A5C5Y0L2_9PLAN|nr:hypothetical protein Pan14r_04230 [Crateriforma conspicua]